MDDRDQTAKEEKVAREIEYYFKVDDYSTNPGTKKSILIADYILEREQRIREDFMVSSYPIATVRALCEEARIETAERIKKEIVLHIVCQVGEGKTIEAVNAECDKIIKKNT